MKTKTDQYIEEKTQHGNPFYTVTKDQWEAGQVAQIRNICCANQAPIDWAVLNVQMPDGARVKAVMRMDDLLAKVGSICASIETLGHKDRISRRLRFALHGNTIASLEPSDFPPPPAPDPNGTSVPYLDGQELDQRKSYEAWSAAKTEAA
jgi:hypothetical protein